MSYLNEEMYLIQKQVNSLNKDKSKLLAKTNSMFFSERYHAKKDIEIVNEEISFLNDYLNLLKCSQDLNK